MNYYVGEFIVIEAADGSEPSVPALVVGLEQKVTVITPGKKIRTFTTKEFDQEFLNIDGTQKDLGDQSVTEVFLNKRQDGCNSTFVILDEVK